jgi:hypothetical protein
VGLMARIEIVEFEFTDLAIDKLWGHRIDPEQLYAVLAKRHVITRNRPGRAAPHVLIDRDEQGRCLAIPVAPTHDRLIWRVITAWYCKPSEAAKLR